jgi:predicted exporter
MKDVRILWPAVVKAVISTLALFATLIAVFPALRLVIRMFIFDQ